MIKLVNIQNWKTRNLLGLLIYSNTLYYKVQHKQTVNKVDNLIHFTLLFFIVS